MMLRKVLIFPFRGEENVGCRFDNFIEWASPFGTAGINEIHAQDYRSNAPYFAWSNSLLAHGDLKSRSWLLKREYLHSGRKVFTRPRNESHPKIIDREGLITEGRFLQFAKAYLNVITHYRMLRSPPKTAALALTFVEKAVRDLNNQNNDPVNLALRSFEKAVRDLLESGLAASVKYDIGKEIEMLAGMVQTGYQSKSFRFEGKGFFLIDKPFAFSSGISAAPRRRAIEQATDGKINRKNKRITSEEVAAVGLAYRKAVALYSVRSPSAFMAAIAGIPLTTTSMRMSELVVLRRDALYLSQDGTARYRLRISRPKIDEHQDLPLPLKLGELACELVDSTLKYSADASEAFQFYVSRFGDDFNAIDKLFIPKHLRTVFEKQYLTLSDLKVIFSSSGKHIRQLIPQGTHPLIRRFVEHPDDISSMVGVTTSLSYRLAKISDIEHSLMEKGIKTKFPLDLDRQLYVNLSVAEKYTINAMKKGKSALNKIFSNGKLSKHCIKTPELLEYLLQQFKSKRFPHWPYVTKERVTKVSDALLVWFTPLNNTNISSGDEKGAWWLPEPVGGSSINIWINRYGNKPGILFEKLDIRLKNGNYPSLTLHQTRKYHHTEALLAGANQIIIDELAGRQSGWQSVAYDLRTPHEILTQSIDTLDPEEDFPVIGPVVKRAKKIKIVDRKAFLYENAAPKHITEVGGCTTDWSLNPCDQFGSCLRCDKQVWRKGDKKRLPHIIDKRTYALKMIRVAEDKLKLDEQPHSLQRQLQQFKDDLARCDYILAIEEDHSVAVGTLVTFDAAEGACGVSELTIRLKHETVQRGSRSK